MLKVATIGGGSSYTPELIEGFINRFERFPIDELWLVDIEEGQEKLDIIVNLAKRMFKKAGLNTKVIGTLDRVEAIKGAKFVTTQFRVGFLEARKWDERIPNEHGLLGQETNGFGGMFKAFRTIPVILDIIKDVEKYAPDAWIINFTNPSGIITQAVYKYTNFKKFIGVCNVPIDMKFQTAEQMNVERDDVVIDFIGLNHLIFGTKVWIKGEDKTKEALEKYLETGRGPSNIASFPWDDTFIKTLGMMLCGYHRYHYKYEDMIKDQLEKFKGSNTRAEQVMEYERTLFEKYKDVNLDVKPEELSKRGGAFYSDVACDVLCSIHNDEKRIHVVNILNNGHIKNLDPSDTIEITCEITKDGAIPLARITELPRPVYGLYQMFKSFELMTCEAAYEGDYNKGILAANLSPFTRSDNKNTIVFNELFKKHEKYLKHFTKNLPE